MDPVQWGQAGAALLAKEWSNVAEQIGIAELGDLAEARPSDIHGTGLFATRDLEMGTLAVIQARPLTVDDTGKRHDRRGHASYFQDFQKAQAPGSRQYFVFPPGVRTRRPGGPPRGSGSRRTGQGTARGFSATLRMTELHVLTTVILKGTSRSPRRRQMRASCRCVSH